MPNHYYLIHKVLFFFFQAEDGIRDDLVTGVQTCALPICSSTIATEFGSCLNRAAHGCSGLVRSNVSAIAARSFRVDQHRTGDLHRYEAPVDGHMQGLTDPRLARPDQRQREGASKLGAAVARRDVAQHGNRWRWKRIVRAQLDDLCALRKSSDPVDRQQPDQLLAQPLLVLDPR